jgi:asparagine synthase (glutamine-hydrolysing)
MCGIAGYFGSPDPLAANRVRRMLRALRHRGPDGAGMFATAPGRPAFHRFAAHVDGLEPVTDLPATAVLGHNWLAIQDTGPAAAQPMRFGSATIVFNGEIYNFIELASAMKATGAAFQTTGDTEVLLQLWAAQQADCLGRLRGMYAFGVYDGTADELTLVRDPFGIKPLYYAMTDRGLYFSSEIRAFHSAGVVPRVIHEQHALACVAAGINKFGETATLYENVFELPPGHLLRLTRDGQHERRSFYALPALAASRDGDAAGDELREALVDSVRVHLRASRRIATCLSGGLDSTNLALLIGRASRRSHHDYDTFTIRTTGPQDSELAAAAEVAGVAGLRHTILDAAHDIAPRDVLDMVVACESPNHVIGPINQFLLLRQVASSGATVVLDGQGGDELLSGYPWYVPVLVDAMRRRGDDVSRLQQQLADRLPFEPATARQFDAMFHDPAAWVAAFIWQGAFLGHARDEITSLPSTQYYLSGGGEWSAFRQRMYFQGELQYLLRQEDRLGMWFGLECRVPFVDTALVALAATFDPAWLIQDGYLKYPYRVMLPELPDSVRWNTRKRGFWETDRDHFPWVGGDAGRRMSLASPTLRRLFPTVESEWNTLSFDQHWRLLQVAVLERCGTREDAAALAGEMQ